MQLPPPLKSVEVGDAVVVVVPGGSIWAVVVVGVTQHSKRDRQLHVVVVHRNRDKLGVDDTSSAAVAEVCLPLLVGAAAENMKQHRVIVLLQQTNTPVAADEGTLELVPLCPMIAVVGAAAAALVVDYVELLVVEVPRVASSLPLRNGPLQSTKESSHFSFLCKKEQPEPLLILILLFVYSLTIA